MKWSKNRVTNWWY